MWSCGTCGATMSNLRSSSGTVWTGDTYETNNGRARSQALEDAMKGICCMYPRYLDCLSEIIAVEIEDDEIVPVIEKKLYRIDWVLE